MSKDRYLVYSTLPFSDLAKFSPWQQIPKNLHVMIVDAEGEDFIRHIRAQFDQVKAQKAFLGIRRLRWFPRIAFFDMDATVIKEETLDAIAQHYTGLEKMSDITEQAMAGKMDFAQSLFSRLQLLKGCPLNTVRKVASEVTLQTHIEKLIAHLHQQSVPCFLISGGFTEVALPLAKRLNFSGLHANEFEIDDRQCLTGRLANPTIVDERNKFDWIKMKCLELNIPLKDAMAVGDGANDRTMLAHVGLGVGFQPKDVLSDVISAINFTGDHGLLADFLGDER